MYSVAYIIYRASKGNRASKDGSMAKQEKFSIIKKRLESKGYELVRINGSHHVFAKKGSPIVSIPVHGRTVKPYYVRQVDKL